MKYLEGDLLSLAERGHFDIIVHGANCFNTMASGIAGQIASKYPEVRIADNNTRKGDKSKLGTFSVATVDGEGDHRFQIFNAYTQYTFSRSKDVFEYDSFKHFLDLLLGVIELSFKGSKIRIGFPYIGCGLAGGDETRIVKMLEDFSKSCTKLAEVSLVRLSK